MTIRFRNLSDKNIYFKNPINNTSIYLDIINTIMHRPGKDLNTLKKVYNSYVDDSSTFYVSINKNFLIVEKSQYENYIQQKEYITTYATNELSMLYGLLKLQNFYNLNNYQKQSQLFNYEEKRTVTNPKELKEDIWNMERQQKEFEIQNQIFNNSNFIYLESEESKIIEFDLLGFKLIGGNYEFHLNFNSIDGMNQLDKDKISKEENINQMKNGYYLYKNAFFSNSVKVSF